jgi:orotate phosphoribosyltransferase
MGADPIAIGTALQAVRLHNIGWFSVRKEQKRHGHQKLIEGADFYGRKVTVVDDVSTSGESTIQAIKVCREAGMDIAQILILIDREQGGLERIKEVAGPSVVPVEALFTLTQIRETCQRCLR